MKHLKLAFKMGLLIAVLAATALAIAVVGYHQLGVVNERLRATTEVANQQVDYCTRIRIEVFNSLRGERGAVMSHQDEEAKEYADKARAANERIEALRKQLAPLTEQNADVEDQRLLGEFETHWAEFKDVQEKSLPLAVLHTTDKAHALSYGKVWRKIASFKETIQGLLRQLDRGSADALAAKDMSRVAELERRGRQMQRAVLGAAETHRLLNRHLLANMDEEAKNQIEEQLTEQQKEVDTLLASLAMQLEPKDQAQLQPAVNAWKDLKELAVEMQGLSRTNSNNRSIALSSGPLVQALNQSVEALRKLSERLQKKLEGDLKTTERSSAAAQRLMLIVPAIGVPIGLLLGGLLTRSITRPMSRGVELTQAIAQGDLTQRVGLEQRDEVGQLTQALDGAAATFARIVGDIRQVSAGVASSASELSGVSHQLLAQSEEMATQAGHVAGSTGQMETNINTMAAAAEQMSLNVVSISSASEQISVNVGTISAAAEGAARNVGAVSEAVRQATRAFETIATDARAGSQVASQAMELAQHATGTMNLLDRAAGEINKVTEAIKMIALQTNLLALNATIEATAAGEAGKGFAVVAHEIKELANQSGKAAEDIARRIEGVQESKQEVVQAIGAVSEIIQTINTSAGRISEAVEKQSRGATASAANLDEASKGVGNIAGSIAEVAKGATDMSRNAAEAATGASDVSRNAAEAARAVCQISSNIQGVSQATRDNTSSAQRVNAAAAKLSDIAAALQKIVGQFKIE